MSSTIGYLWGATVGAAPGVIAGGVADATVGAVPSLTFPIIGDILAGLLDPAVQAGVAALALQPSKTSSVFARAGALHLGGAFKQ